MNNKYMHIFKITDNNFKTLTIKRNEDTIINTFISISPSTIITEEESYQNKYFIIHIFRISRLVNHIPIMK